MAAIPRVALITGTSSGVGLTTSLLLAEHKFKVYASMRNTDKAGDLLKAAKERGVSDNIEVVELDVSKEDKVDQCVKNILSKTGRIDVLINNAGFSFAKPTEFTSMAEFREIFDTNFFGAVAVTKSIIPHMRENKSGHIINIASYGGLVGQPFNDAYCAAKFAVSGWSESLYTSLMPFGVKVTLVCPGAITTPFLSKAAATASIDPNNPYFPLQKAYIDTMTKVFTSNAASGVKSSQTPAEISDVLLNILLAPKPQQMYLTSEYIGNLAANKYKDITGDSIVELTMKRSYGGDLKL